MKACIGTFLLVVMFVSCSKEQTNHWQNTLFVFYQSSDSTGCEPLETDKGDCYRGKLFLTAEGKALYFFQCRKTDSVKYFRGTYKVTDSIVNCIFDSRLNRGKDPQKEKPHFQEITRQIVTLRPLACEGDQPLLITTDLHYIYDSLKERVFTFLSKADLNVYHEFCSSMLIKPALVDFRCQEKGDTSYKVTRTIDEKIMHTIIDHYKNKNPKSHMRQSESDSAINLAFSYLKKKKHDDVSPYLYITIPKPRQFYLFGDLNTDGKNDIVAAPVLTQGGDTYWQDIVVFLGNDAGHDLLPVVSAMDIAKCTANSYNGTFIPQKIQNGTLIGTTSCYTDDDAACCPSVKMETHYVLENKKLKLQKK